MRKLLTSIFVLITATAITHTYTELESNASVESFDFKKEIISSNTIESTSKIT